MSDAFKDLAHAASDAERLSGDWLRRVSFTPGQKTELLNRLASPMAMASRSSRGMVSMPDRSSDPFEVVPYQRGWHMLGQAMVWKIERAVSMEEPDTAVDWTVAATRFGLALTAGNATDAALGYTIIEDAQRALAPAIPNLSTTQLRNLGTGLEAALRNKPSTDSLVENEGRSMVRAVQFIQDLYRDRKLGSLTDELGRDIDPAIDYLEKLRGKDPKRRATYFDGFAAEAASWADHYRSAFRKNARQRAGSSGFEIEGERPWRRFSRHFFQGLEPLIAMRDKTLAQTRLLGLSSLLHAECRTNGVAPSALTGLSRDLTVDPFSGYELIYRADGEHFLLYSIGPDLKDDGGESSIGEQGPDLRASGDDF